MYSYGPKRLKLSYIIHTHKISITSSCHVFFVRRNFNSILIVEYIHAVNENRTAFVAVRCRSVSLRGELKTAADCLVPQTFAASTQSDATSRLLVTPKILKADNGHRLGLVS
jgi:hypothetical protein